MQLTIHTFELQLKHTFSVSHGSRDSTPCLIVALSQNGQTGYGEASAIPYYGLDLQEMVDQLERIRPRIESLDLQTPEAFSDQLQQWLPDAPFPRCALDVAAHDLFGKLRQQTVYQRWGLSTENTPLSSYTIGLDRIEGMVQKMQEQPWPLYKIKLGTGNDLAIIQALRKHTDARFRVDANTAWTAEQTIALAPELKALGVDFIEQPLKVADWAGMKQVYEQSVLPIIADESCQTEADIERCQGYFHGVNIKLMKCGGLTPARRMIDRAQSLGLKTMVGCMTESSVGISAIAQLLPLLDYVDMDGAMLITNDPAEGVRLVKGRAVFPEGYGTGVGGLKG